MTHGEKLNCVALGWGSHFLAPDLYHQILICINLMNLTDSPLMTPWNPTPPQRSADPKWMMAWTWCNIFVKENQTQHYTVWIFTKLVNTTCPYLVIPEKLLYATCILLRLFQPAGSSVFHGILGLHGSSPDPILVPEGLGIQLGSSNLHPSLEQAVSNHRLFCSS